MNQKPLLTLQITYKSILMYCVWLLKYSIFSAFFLFVFFNILSVYTNTHSLELLNFPSFLVLFQITLLWYLVWSLFVIPSMLYKYIGYRKIDIFRHHTIVINDKLEVKNVKFTLNRYIYGTYQISFFSNNKKIASFYLGTYVQEPPNTPIQVYESIVQYGTIIHDDEDIEEFRKWNRKIEVQSYIIGLIVFSMSSYMLFT